MVPAPPVRRRLVGRTLRRYREACGYKLDEAASILECDRSKVSRIETGERGIRPKELRELLAEYGTDAEQQEVLLTLADPRGSFGWPRGYADVLPPAWYDYLIVETAATKVSCHEGQQVPALVQTPAYARALASADPRLADAKARDKAAEAVTARQQAILGADNPPEVRLIIGEAALLQQVGSPAVMREQLATLAERAADTSSSVTVQVLPFDTGVFAAVGDGSMAVAQCTAVPGLGLVHLGWTSGGVCREEPDELNDYASAFDQLRAHALTPERSAQRLRGAARRQHR